MGKSTYMYCIPDLLLSSFFNQFRSADFPFRFLLFDFVDSCAERDVRKDVIGSSGILNIRRQHVMGDKIRSIWFPVMGTKFHLGSRDVIVEALVTWTRYIQSAITPDKEWGDGMRSSPWWCMQNRQIISVKIALRLSQLLIHRTITSSMSVGGLQKRVKSR